MPTAPTFEERDFQTMAAALQILEAMILTRDHMAATHRQLTELQRYIEKERQSVNEKAARGQLRKAQGEAEQRAIDRAVGRRPAPAPGPGGLGSGG
jgi:hypothetical protein